MKRAVVGFLLVVALGASACGSKKSPDSASSDTSAPLKATPAETLPVALLTARASQITDQLIAKKFDDATKSFNGTLLGRFDAQSLKTAWDSIVSTIGPYKSRSATTIFQGVYETPMLFGSTHMKSRITFDDQGKVSDLLIVKA